MATTAPPTLPPNQSLYIQNLNEKLQKDDLRRELYMLFSTYGPVLDITALKTKAMRGQAHVLFRDVGAATQAMRAQNGEEFFGREMRISYSKNRSDTLAKLTGTFAPPATAAAAIAQAAAPVSSIPAPPGSLPLPPGLKAPAGNAASPSPAPSQGTKRAREESGDEAGKSEEEEDDDGAMDMSDDDD